MSHFVTFGGYALLSLVGRGGGGEVWRARRREDLYQPGEDVALKRPLEAPSEALRESLRREAEELRGLVHPNLVPAREYGEAEGRPFLVMPLVEGTNLGRLLDAQAQGHLSLSPELAALIALDIAQGLAFLHAKQWVHQDISPQNVLLSISGEVRLTDYGPAMVQSTRAHELGSAAPSLGTPGYLAPEDEVSPGADLFALGVLFWEMLAKERLFPHLSRAEVGARLLSLSGPATKRPGVPDALDAIAKRALSASVPERFSRAEEWINALQAAVPDFSARRAALAALVHEHFPPACGLHHEETAPDAGHLIAVEPELLPSGLESTAPAALTPLLVETMRPKPNQTPPPAAPASSDGAAQVSAPLPAPLPAAPAAPAPIAPASFLPSEAPKNAPLPGLAPSEAPRPIRLAIDDAPLERELRPIRIELPKPGEEEEEEEENYRPMFDMPQEGPGWPLWIGALVFLGFMIAAGAWMLSRLP
jgi:serine/threonine-protein kinase